MVRDGRSRFPNSTPGSTGEANGHRSADLLAGVRMLARKRACVILCSRGDSSGGVYQAAPSARRLGRYPEPPAYML